MMEEIEDREIREHWSIMLRSHLPPGAKIVLSIWSFKRKKLPDGTIQKYKALLCTHGGIQTWEEHY